MTALRDDFGWTLGVVFRACVRATNAVVGDLPGGHRGYQILTAATRDQPESQSALGQQLVIRKPAPTDRRTRLVVAAETGRARLVELDRELAHAEAHVLSGLPKGDRETFKALLCGLAGYVNELDPVPSACQAVQDIAASAP